MENIFISISSLFLVNQNGISDFILSLPQYIDFIFVLFMVVGLLMALPVLTKSPSSGGLLYADVEWRKIVIFCFGLLLLAISGCGLSIRAGIN